MSELRNKLFNEFPPVSTKEWEQKIQKDLKGADYDKKLIWKTIEGIRVKPYYRKSDLENLSITDLPGEFPYTRGNRTKNNDWEIRQEIFVKNIEEANSEALDVLQKGTNALCFNIGNNTINCQADFDKLVEGIYLNIVPIHFISGSSTADFLTMLANNCKSQKLKPEEIKGSDDFDPIRYLTVNGHFYYNDEKRAFERAAKIIKFTKKNLPYYKSLSVNGQYFHNSGGTIVQELAFSLSSAVEYLSRLTDLGLSVDDIASRVQFIFAIDTNYFMEIAKLRAVRKLWAVIVDSFNPANKKSLEMCIHSITARWSQTIFDSHINMLRGTTEAMSAVLGGTNSLTVSPYNLPLGKINEFSQRIARNTQIILKEEAYFDKVIDPAAGSYYIENLTQSLTNEAWKLFLKIEEMGGYTSAFKKGFIQEQIENTASMRNTNIARRKDTLLGTNQFPNLSEKISDKTGLDYLKRSKAETNKETVELLGRPLQPYRGAEAYELLRLKTENAEKTPEVFLLTYGNPAMRTARASFSANFFGCAGYTIVNNPGFDSVEKGIEAVAESNPAIVVFCSSDDEYLQIDEQIVNKFPKETILVLAGYPKDSLETLKQAGIEHFIHIRSNVLEELQKFHGLLRIG